MELQKMNTENQRLKDMLGQVTTSYSALQMHFAALMQQHQQQNHGKESNKEQQVINFLSKQLTVPSILDMMAMMMMILVYHFNLVQVG
jgi:hypothetical protein